MTGTHYRFPDALGSYTQEVNLRQVGGHEFNSGGANVAGSAREGGISSAGGLARHSGGVASRCI